MNNQLLKLQLGNDEQKHSKLRRKTRWNYKIQKL